MLILEKRLPIPGYGRYPAHLERSDRNLPRQRGGFRQSSQGSPQDNLRNRFIGIARQRADLADELAGHVRRLGGDPPNSGHQSGIQQRRWLELETSIRPKDDASFIAECQMGEENILRHYERAVTYDLAPDLRPMIERHRLAVQEALLELRGLEQVRAG